MKSSLHHPPHIYLDDTWYMFTASTYERKHLLTPPGRKEFSRDLLIALLGGFKLHIAAWVILDNHYHILAKSYKGNDLTIFFRRFQGRTSFEFNKQDGIRGRKMWHNYWDRCIRTESDYWKRFNYIHHNPVKHGYVQKMEEWSYSSYRWYLEHRGSEWLADAFTRFPIVDYTELIDMD